MQILYIVTTIILYMYINTEVKLITSIINPSSNKLFKITMVQTGNGRLFIDITYTVGTIYKRGNRGHNRHQKLESASSN